MEFHESYRFENVSIQNTTKINDSRFVDYLQDSGFKLLKASHNGVTYVFCDWIYNVEFISDNGFVLKQDGTYLSHNETKNDINASRYEIAFLNINDMITIKRIKQNGKTIRSLTTAKKYYQILLLFNSLVQIGKIPTA